MGHISLLSALLTDLLEDPVGFEDATPKLGNLVVCGAIITRVTPSITVGTFLLLKAVKFIAQENSSCS